ncbi:MAG: DUF418 domain-containing protein [Dysgonomonas sp.]
MKNIQRIEVADALRGFAIMGILLLHTIEHFNFYSFPEVSNSFLKFTDKAVWESLFFTFGGKAYGIFALLFGFSFFIQDRNQLDRGNDFRPRFLWRLFLLFIWGNINAMFFTGEILVLYSLLGIVLVFTARIPTKAALIIAIVFMLQPLDLGKLIYALLNPEYVPGDSMAMSHFKEAYIVQSKGTFFETVKMNLWHGQLASLTWAWENGRIFQTSSFFILGMLIGRCKLFIYNEKNIKFWQYVLVTGVICFFPLNGLANLLPDFIENPAILTPLTLIIRSLANFGFMAFLVGVFILAYYNTDKIHSILKKLIPYGQMSLTNYITQSIVGSMLFYNWGFALHNKLCITFSFFLAIVLFILQYMFCKWWMAHHKQGPLEYIWKKATWIGTKK